MTDMPVKLRLSDLATHLWMVLENYEDTHSREEVIRAAGEALGAYLIVCGLRDRQSYVPATVFGEAVVEVTPRFMAAYTEGLIAISGGRN